MNGKAVYQWRPRTRFTIDPQVAGEELEKIKGHNSGDLTPEMVVSAATSPNSPLHAAFEWNNAKAAQQQRLHVAGLLIRSVVVTVTPSNDSSPEPVKVTVTSAAGPSGNAAARVISAEELHAKKVQRGWDELEQWHKQYGGLSEFAGVGSAVSAFLSVRASEQKAVAKKTAA